VIYLDTNLWNTLLDQTIAPGELISSFSSKGMTLTISNDNIYELAKTFLMPAQAGTQRGVGLFSYLKGFISEQVPFTKVNMELLAAEMWALQLQESEINPFLNAADYEITRGELERLSRGELSERVLTYLNWRKNLANYTRSGQIGHFVEQPELKRHLEHVSAEQLPAWLEDETTGGSAISYLAGQIRDYFPEAPATHAAEYAQALLRSSVCRVAKGLARRNFYYNWRCANRESVPGDLYDDSNHILNSNYCHIYATGEQKQMEYAELLLTPSTKVAVYNGQIPIDEWLLALG
jgi:hypothetical protein